MLCSNTKTTPHFRIKYNNRVVSTVETSLLKTQ